MKNVFKMATLSLMAVSALVLSPVSAFALAIDGSGDTSTQTKTTVDTTKKDTSMQNTTSIDATVDANVRGNDDADTNHDDSSMSAEVNGSEDSSTDLETNSQGVAIRLASQVDSDADLQVFGNNIRKEYDEVRSVDVSSQNEISVSYAHVGRLFGFIPVTINSTTNIMVDAEGNTVAKTHMPWWNMFVAGTHEISSNVDSSLSNSASARAAFSADASAAERARAIEAIIKAHASLDANAQAAARS